MRTALALVAAAFAFASVACSRPAPSTTAPSPAPVAPAPPVASAPAPAPLTPPVAMQAALAPRVEAPAPRPATALRVDRLVIARGVEGHEPVGTDTVFAKDEKRLFAFVEVGNPERLPGDVRVSFVAPDGTSAPDIELHVGAEPRFRTWAFTRRAKTSGTWTARVLDARGKVLASTEFDVRG